MTYWINSSSDRHIEVTTVKFTLPGGGYAALNNFILFAVVGVLGSFFSSITARVGFKSGFIGVMSSNASCYERS